MEGVVNGVYYCHMDRTTELSERMFERNLPNAPLQVNYDPRPAETRYVQMPILDCRSPATVPRERRPVYNTNVMFSPGTSLPFSGYQKSIDKESRLYNITFPLQSCPQAKFIPGTSSDLYHNSYLTATTKPVRMTNPYLFTRPKFAPFDPNSCKTGYKLFNNFTRQQIRGLVDDKSKKK